LEKQLDPARFFRANRQFIVNLESIKFLGNYFGGKLILRLSGYPQIEIVISKDKAPLIKSWIDR
jgi:DNA-binding LytR/AlgR family response regulator